ncbi:MAG TPA: right-handed parallel beta-helix repeat-containing protein [Acidimicrobiales bacterium]|nr:right-handed parallel beta-helix repeat-containing protein [Acidimicrobiales bacterium]
MTTARRALAALLVGALVLAAACGGDDDEGSGGDDGGGAGETTGGTTLAVPEDYDTIQAAVDAASPGDLILVSPGTYEEAVNVETDELTIRGLDRNEVILDGGFEKDNGIRVAGADGVAIENMTARNYTNNGFFWTGVEGYRGSYLTTYRIGDYGVYAFDSTRGLLEHSYASGSPDAGFYIGQCYPCDAVIDDVVSEYNGLGYSGTNSGGDLYIVNSTFRFNRAGIVPNSGSYELCYPSRGTTIVGNTVYANNQPDTPAIDVALTAMGNGILPAGAVNTVIERNLVYDHDLTGIGLVPFPEDDPSDDVPPPSDDERPCAEAKNDQPADPATIANPLIWNPRGNRVVGNVVESSRLADIAVGSLEDISQSGNCFGDNTFGTSAPLDLQTLAPCEGTGSGDWSAGALDLGALIAAAENAPGSGDYKTSPIPGPQESMPDAADSPARPATDVPRAVDLDAIEVPTKPS